MQLSASLLLRSLALLHIGSGDLGPIDEPAGFEALIGLVPSSCHLTITDPLVCKGFTTTSASDLYETVRSCIDALAPSCMIHIVVKEISQAVCPDYPSIIKANKFPSEYEYDSIQLYLVPDDSNQDSDGIGQHFRGDPMLPVDSTGIGVDDKLPGSKPNQKRGTCNIKINDTGSLMGIVGQPACGFSSSTLLADATSGGINPILVSGLQIGFQSNYAYYLEFSGCKPDIWYLKTWSTALIPGNYIQPEAVLGRLPHFRAIFSLGMLVAIMSILI